MKISPAHRARVTERSAGRGAPDPVDVRRKGGTALLTRALIKTAVLLLVAGCSLGPGGRVDDPSSGSSPLSPFPPAADVLPDGGTTADGGAASDKDRMLTQLLWFTGRVQRCEMEADGLTRTYPAAVISVRANQPDFYTLEFELARDAASIDRYEFTVDLFHGDISIEENHGEIKYHYGYGLFGANQHRVLTVNPARPEAWLTTTDSRARPLLACE